MNLKDMTDLILVYDAYKRLDYLMDHLVGVVEAEEGSVVSELRRIEDVIARNSVLYQQGSKDPMFDINESEHMDVLNDKKLTAEQRAFRLLAICNEA